ncbi:MAG TPA: hypothetical protein VGR89_13770 [Puia sp.]|nr:hypothetical protein [Puia sp.]
MNSILIAKLFASSLSLVAPAKDTSVVGDTTSVTQRTHLNISMTYNSIMNYYGRTDSVKYYGLYPAVGIEFKGGIYVNGSFVFIGNDQRRQYAATVLEAGYNFASGNGHWAGNLSATKYYYQGNTDLVQSVIRGMAAASLTNLNNIANVTLEANARFSDKVDEGLQGGLDHTIRLRRVLASDGVLIIDPTVTVYSGTQHFTQTFLQEQKFLFLPTGEQALSQNSQVFSILAYEASLPVVYGLKGLNVVFDPAYILPQHVLGANGEVVPPASVSNLFYITLTMKIAI